MKKTQKSEAVLKIRIKINKIGNTNQNNKNNTSTMNKITKHKTNHKGHENQTTIQMNNHQHDNINHIMYQYLIVK